MIDTAPSWPEVIVVLSLAAVAWCMVFLPPRAPRPRKPRKIDAPRETKWRNRW